MEHDGGGREDKEQYVVSRDQLATPYSWCASNGDQCELGHA